ncbi:PREDICTED: serine/threonine-protein kinase D3-like, partial [Papilio xuthus]|uniref:Serine/threonine-protein kinase D3-like n=1 Tax=Papilio xuthus TaxID=66420 RepID=A0AAJ6ZKR8_PAPXU
VGGTSKRSASAWPPPSSLGIPHTFQVHTYTRPTVCRLCKKLLRGLFKQGLQCGDCHYNAHRKCLPFVPKDCGAEIRDAHSEYQDSSTGSELSENARLPDEESDEGADGATDDADHELSRRGQEEEPQRDTLPDRSASRPSSSSSSPSANIPLMRIVQSVKHTKKREGQWLKEGWMVHFTNKDKTIKRHYWRLDSKSITLFTSEQGTKYYKEIPLNEILAVDTARQPHSDVMHCFELRTANVDYMVGVDPAWAGAAGAVPPPPSGVGAYLARSWETAVRQALMP